MIRRFRQWANSTPERRPCHAFGWTASSVSIPEWPASEAAPPDSRDGKLRHRSPPLPQTHPQPARFRGSFPHADDLIELHQPFIFQIPVFECQLCQQDHVPDL